jgi:hypothetical protein
MKLADRIQKALSNVLTKVPQGQNLSDMMSGVQPVNELVRPMEHVNSNAFAIYGGAKPDGYQFFLPKPPNSRKEWGTETW